jgi:hypothetical protein
MLFELQLFSLGWPAALCPALITIFFNVQGAHSQIFWDDSCTQNFELSTDLLTGLSEAIEVAQYGLERIQRLQNPLVRSSGIQVKTFRTFAAYFTSVFSIPPQQSPLQLLDPNAVTNARSLEGKLP